jgi:hypothetical protein
MGIQVFKGPITCGHWETLPTEIVIDILSHLSIPQVLCFASSSRYLYHRFGNPAFLSMLLRSQLRQPNSSIHWVLPVDTVKGEVEKFYQACNESMESVPKESTDASIAFDGNFPLLEFLQTNWTTDSMRNRRRFWRISQQFRREWYKYRTEGYEYNVFEKGACFRAGVRVPV